MKNIIKYIAIISTIALFSVVSTSAATPYKGYTYNQWGNAVPSPCGYVPDRFITGLDMDTTTFDSPQDIFVDKAKNQMYIADTGNNRIVVVDSNYKFLFEINELKSSKGETDTLNAPSGVFVDSDQNIFIADTKNGRIVKCDQNGKIISIVGAPVNAAFGKEFEYIPLKLVVDRDGLMYIQALNVFQGLICMDQQGRFIQFFGSSKVEITPKLLWSQFLRNFMTKDQREGVIGFINTEYSNLCIDNKGFIYAVVSKSDTSLNEIKKLNSNGDNILRVNPYGNSAAYFKNNYGDYPILYTPSSDMVDTTFTDVNFDEAGMISALDSARGRVFVYDEESNLMFIFGVLGSQLGSFTKPVALEKFGTNMVVLDSATNGITTFRLTEFGQNVVGAIKLYNDGKYLEAIEPWNNVIRQNSNYILAYDSIGKAYLRLEKYGLAMKYFKLGYDKLGYSNAQAEYVTKLARQNMPVVFIILVLFGAFPFVLPSIIMKLKRIRKKRQYEQI